MLWFLFLPEDYKYFLHFFFLFLLTRLEIYRIQYLVIFSNNSQKSLDFFHYFFPLLVSCESFIYWFWYLFGSHESCIYWF